MLLFEVLFVIFPLVWKPLPPPMSSFAFTILIVGRVLDAMTFNITMSWPSTLQCSHFLALQNMHLNLDALPLFGHSFFMWGFLQVHNLLSLFHWKGWEIFRLTSLFNPFWPSHSRCQIILSSCNPFVWWWWHQTYYLPPHKISYWFFFNMECLF